MTDHKWQVGQQAVINRQTIVTVDKVTPTGRVTAGGRTFGKGGYEMGERGSVWRQHPRIEPLTPEIEAEIALRKRANDTRVFDALKRAAKWSRDALYAWNGRTPDAADVEKAERLAAAILDVLGTANGP